MHSIYVHAIYIVYIYSIFFIIAVGQEQWQPLLRPSFLETLWQKLLCLWRSLGFLPEAASFTAQPSFSNYVQSGSYPDSRGKQPKGRFHML